MPSLIAVLGANISPFTRELNRARGEAKAIGGKIAGDFKGELVGRLAGVASVAGVALGAERAVELGGKISDLSNRLGMSTDAIQEWDYALRMNGSTMEAAASFFEKLAISRALVMKGGDVAKAPTEAFKKLGLSVEELKSKRIEDIAAKIAKVFEGGDPQRFIDSLREVGGKGAGEMVATFSQGFAQMREDAHKFGQVMRSDVVDSLDEAGDTMDRLGRATLVNVFAPIAEGVMWTAARLNEALQGMVLAFSTFYNGLRNLKSPMEMSRDYQEALRINAKLQKEEEDNWSKIKEAKRKAAGKTPAALADEEARATRERQQTELDKINELIEAEQRRAVRSMMNAREKAEMDRAELAVLNKKIAAAKDPVEKAKLKLEYEKGLTELQGDLKGDLSKTAERFLNQYTAIGGFGSAMSQGPEMRRLDYERRSEGHLQKIVNLNEAAKRALEKLSRRADIPNTDVQY